MSGVVFFLWKCAGISRCYPTDDPLSLASLITVLLAVILLVLELVLLIAQRKKLYLLLVAMCLVCLIVSAGLALASHAILLLSAGM